MSGVFTFTGLVKEVNPTWRANQVSIAPCSPMDRVAETLFAEPPSWVRIENQRQTNTCAAHAGSSCMEKVEYLATRQLTQLSRNYLYLRGQQACGLAGRDQGCTLGGIIRAMTTNGCCEEDLWPFNGTYQQSIPAPCDEAAAKRKVTKTLDVEARGYDGFREVLGQNIGAVLMATSWPLRMLNGYIVEDYAPQGAGGHAIAGLFLSDKRDNRQRPYVWVANSHDITAQKQGWMLWSPNALDSLIQSADWGVTGITDMLTPKPRAFDWGTESFFS